jgi:hypothetical protein
VQVPAEGIPREGISLFQTAIVHTEENAKVTAL